MKNRDNDKLLDAAKTADLLGVSKQCLANWRTQGRPELKYIKVGRLVKYRLSDVRSFVENATVDHSANSNI